MRSIDLKAKDEPVFALVYGDSGTGKTELCATCAELGNTLVIDIDKGVMTIVRSKRLAGVRSSNKLTVVSFDTFDDLDDAYQSIKRNDPEEWTKLFKCEDNPITEPFKYFVWDSWTEMQWELLTELRKSDGLDSKTAPVKLDTFRKNLQIQHWGRLTDMNKLCVESLRNLAKEIGVHMIFTMLESYSKDDVTGKVSYGPAIHGKLVKEFPAYFNVVVYTYVDLSGKYHATTKPKGNYPAKTRLGEGQDHVDAKAKTLFV